MTTTITFAVQDDLAPHLQANAMQIGARLFRWHKNQMCHHALAVARIRGKGHVKPAIEEWLDLHGVGEDEFGHQTAYKAWQRFAIKFRQKTPLFPAQFTGKTGAFLGRRKAQRAQKARRAAHITWRLSDIQVEMALGRFMASVKEVFSRPPFRLEKHARIWMYMSLQGLSQREVAKKFDLKRISIRYICSAMERRIQTNPTIARLLEAAIALPTLI